MRASEGLKVRLSEGLKVRMSEGLKVRAGEVGGSLREVGRWYVW